MKSFTFLKYISSILPRDQRPDFLKLKHIEFSRWTKISRGLTAAYELTSGKFCRYLLYATIHRTLRDHREYFSDVAPITLQWAEKKKSNQQKHMLFAEHGWLPRSSYQLSSKGCNSRSHVKFKPTQDYIGILGGKAILRKLKQNLRKCMGDEREVPHALTDAPFFVVALQTGTDLNLLNSGTRFANYYRQKRATEKFGQALIDHVESMERKHRVIFTQHPADKSNSRYMVHHHNRIVYAHQGVRTLDLLRHEQCQGVIAVNSNILHEAMLWQRPTCALGYLLASQKEASPFCSELEPFLIENTQTLRFNELVDQYLAMLIAYQWTLSDFQNPLILRRILVDSDSIIPWNIRKKYGYAG
jgi:hypothetical protein